MRRLRTLDACRSLGAFRACAGVAAAALLALGACEDALFVEPAPPISALAIAFPAWSEAAGGPAAAFDKANRARLVLNRQSTTLKDTTLAFSPQPLTTLRLDLDVPDAVTSAQLLVELSRGTDLLFRGSQSIQLRRGRVDTAEVSLAPVVAGVRVPDSVAPINAIGDTARVQGATLFATGDTVAVGTGLTWSTPDTALVRVLSDGRVISRATGRGRVIGTSGRFADTVSVLVRQIPATVRVTPAGDTLVLGDTLRLVASVADSNGVAISGGTFTWTSSETRIATVDATGLVRAAGGGTVSIQAASGTASGSASLRVHLALSASQAAAITVGRIAACAIDGTGSTSCWGNNAFGQLGSGSTVLNSAAPVSVAGGRRFVALSGRFNHFCGLLSTGEPFCWGLNDYGRLGDGTTTQRSTPVAVAPGGIFASLSAGHSHTCGLTSWGKAYCWGRNEDGQLGDGTTTQRLTPVAVASGVSFSSINAGGLHTCAVTAAGAAYCWGRGTAGQLGDGGSASRTTPVLVSGSLSFSAIEAAADSTTCGLTSGGGAYCWGTLNGSRTPAAVPGGITFLTLAAGDGFACGISSSGNAGHCWGNNDEGVLGNGTTVSSSSPTSVSGGHAFRSLRAGHWNVCGITVLGQARCWGLEDAGATGVSAGSVRPTPTAVLVTQPFQSVAVSHFDHTCGITTGGSTYCWGRNGDGQVGNGSTTDSSVPVAVSGPAFIAVALGYEHSCGLTRAGAAYCWGSNQFGQLGITASPGQSALPVAVRQGSLVFSALAGGGFFTCGLASGGQAYCWGRNAAGELGDGTTTQRSTPVAVTGSITLASIVAGLYHACGRTSAGQAHCWGSSSSGQLGNGATTASTRPVAVSGGLLFPWIGTGWYHSCGLTSAGQMHCWGDNTYGQLGNGTTQNSSVPVAVSGVTFGSPSPGYPLPVGDYHTCGLTASLQAFCWGGNFSAQLGDGTFTDRTRPVTVSGGLAFATLAAGRTGTCGVTSAGQAYCWGYIGHGRLGDGQFAFQSTPALVSEDLSFEPRLASAATRPASGFQFRRAPSGPVPARGTGSFPRSPERRP